MFQTCNHHPGQVAVTILLTMVVLMTVGLSVATQSTEEQIISQQTEESTRVFHTAESIVEQGLAENFEAITDATPFENTDPNLDDNAAELLSIEALEELSISLLPGEVATVNLDGASGDIRFVWGENDDCSVALMVSIYETDGTEVYQTDHYPLQQTGGSCTNSFGGNFIEVSDVATGSFSHLNREWIYTVGADDVFARVMTLRGRSRVAVTGNLPTQQHTVTGTATNSLGAEGSGGGVEQRVVQVTRTLPSAPYFMDFAVYSGGSLDKNVTP